jgi:hypothetical protein
LVRYGHGTDPRVVAGLERMLDDVTDTGQGRAWQCRADGVSGFRGPGRKSDCCPQVTVEALRACGSGSRPGRSATGGRGGPNTAVGLESARRRQALHVRARARLQDRQVATYVVSG